MYYIFGINYSQGKFSIECLLDYPIESKSEAESKWNKAVRVSGKQGLPCGLFDGTLGKWLYICNNGRLDYQICTMLNDRRFGPKPNKTYMVANVNLD